MKPESLLGRRLAARLIDLATVLTALWGLTVLQVFWFMGALSRRVDPEPWGRAFAPTVVFAVLLGVYEVVFVVHSRGQTPGMDMMKLRVVTRDGGRVDAGRAARRWAVAGLLPLLTPLWLAAVALAAVGAPVARDAGRSLRDRAAGTCVVPYDRDREDPTARRPRGRRERGRSRDARLVAGRLRTQTDGTTALGSPQ